MKNPIEIITAADEAEALQTLTMTVVNDPGIMFFSPDASKRVNHTMRMLKAMSGLLGKFGQKYMIREKNKIVAVAMWVPPGKSITNFYLIQAGFFLIPFIMGLRVFRNMMKFLDIATRLQEEHMQNRDHWHLFYLGVHPAYQRKGFGKQVISNVLSEADQTQKPVFVQAFTTEGLNFFKKSDFELISKTKFSEGCIMNCMIREPKSKAVKKTSTKKPVVKTKSQPKAVKKTVKAKAK